MERPARASSAFEANNLFLSLARDAEARDPFKAGHCDRLARYAMALGIALQLPDRDLVALHRGSFLHDIGMIAMPARVLLKPDLLTDAEYDVVKRHTVIGDLLCEDQVVLRAVRPIVRSHHERVDGSGYPDGLSGDEVPLLAQIVSLVDAFDALTTDRSYRVAQAPDAACDILLDETSRGWRSMSLVKEFVALARSKRLGRLRHETDARAAESRGIVPPVSPLHE
jgi:putative two-component system response regulator